MGTAMILAGVIASTLVFSATVLLVASDEWLRGFAELARSLGRLI